MVFNKRGASMALSLIVTAVILLVVAYLVIRFSSKGIKDAGDEFFSILNLNTANCDHDFDGLKDKEDVCPCDSDDYFISRTYYIADATGCQVKQRCGKDPTLERFSECSAKYALDKLELKSETDMLQYYFSLDTSACKKWYDSKGKGLLIAEGGCVPSSTDKQVMFNQACISKVLAWNKEASRATFTCKTPTKDCKDILKKEC